MSGDKTPCKVPPVVLNGVVSSEYEELERDLIRMGSSRRFVFFFTLFTGPRRSSSLELSDTRGYAPHIRARLVTAGYETIAQVIGADRDVHVV